VVIVDLKIPLFANISFAVRVLMVIFPIVAVLTLAVLTDTLLKKELPVTVKDGVVNVIDVLASTLKFGAIIVTVLLSDGHGIIVLIHNSNVLKLIILDISPIIVDTIDEISFTTCCLAVLVGNWKGVTKNGLLLLERKRFEFVL
jgi:hypothetical protein